VIFTAEWCWIVSGDWRSQDRDDQGFLLGVSRVTIFKYVHEVTTSRQAAVPAARRWQQQESMPWAARGGLHCSWSGNQPDAPPDSWPCASPEIFSRFAASR
jgi:hypothetical protein